MLSDYDLMQYNHESTLFLFIFFANCHAEMGVRFQDMILSSALLPDFRHHTFQDGLNNSWIFATVVLSVN